MQFRNARNQAIVELRETCSKINIRVEHEGANDFINQGGLYNIEFSIEFDSSSEIVKGRNENGIAFLIKFLQAHNVKMRFEVLEKEQAKAQIAEYKAEEEREEKLRAEKRAARIAKRDEREERRLKKLAEKAQERPRKR